MLKSSAVRQTDPPVLGNSVEMFQNSAKGMGSSRHRTAERDGLVPAPQSGEGWDRPAIAERRGMESRRHRIRIHFIYGYMASDIW